MVILQLEFLQKKRHQRLLLFVVTTTIMCYKMAGGYMALQELMILKSRLRKTTRIRRLQTSLSMRPLFL